MNRVVGDPQPVRLAEPPIVALSHQDDLTVHCFPDDGSIVLTIGDPVRGGANLLIERHQLTSVWMTLRAIDRGAEIVDAVT